MYQYRIGPTTKISSPGEYIIYNDAVAFDSWPTDGQIITDALGSSKNMVQKCVFLY